MNSKFRERVRNYLSLNEMAMKHFGPEAEKTYSKEELKELFNNTSVEKLADTYVRNARQDNMEDKKIAQGLGATLRGMEDKDKVAKVKEQVKARLNLAGKKKKEEKEEKQEESRRNLGRFISEDRHSKKDKKKMTKKEAKGSTRKTKEKDEKKTKLTAKGKAGKGSAENTKKKMKEKHDLADFQS